MLFGVFVVGWILFALSAPWYVWVALGLWTVYQI